ncbi:MAG: hypothetical protein Q8O25_04240 [Sulfurisoma sp.]|nr:hypothetical protein [Sulfurisoma sp.]
MSAMRALLLPLLLTAVLALVLAGCAASGAFEPGQLAKTDIDRVADAHRREVFASLRLVAEKLYRRNPREWKKGGQASMEAALARLFDPALAWRLPELEERRGTEAVLLALREDWRGDRVAALVAGLGGMLHGAFNERTEFYVLDDLDPQRLHNSARNLEIAAWKLAHARGADGELLLLANEMAPVQNLSFEREFGKMIGNLDLLSRIVADKTNRAFVKIVQSMATAVFLPVLPVPTFR